MSWADYKKKLPRLRRHKEEVKAKTQKEEAKANNTQKEEAKDELLEDLEDRLRRLLLARGGNFDELPDFLRDILIRNPPEDYNDKDRAYKRFGDSTEPEAIYDEETYEELAENDEGETHPPGPPPNTLPPNIFPRNPLLPYEQQFEEYRRTFKEILSKCNTGDETLENALKLYTDNISYLKPRRSEIVDYIRKESYATKEETGGDNRTDLKRPASEELGGGRVPPPTPADDEDDVKFVASTTIPVAAAPPTLADDEDDVTFVSSTTIPATSRGLKPRPLNHPSPSGHGPVTQSLLEAMEEWDKRLMLTIRNTETRLSAYSLATLSTGNVAHYCMVTLVLWRIRSSNSRSRNQSPTPYIGPGDIYRWGQCGGILVLGIEAFREGVGDEKTKDVLIKKPALVFIDEVHRVKNPTTNLARAVKLIKTPHCVGLTADFLMSSPSSDDDEDNDDGTIPADGREVVTKAISKIFRDHRNWPTPTLFAPDLSYRI
ncbi:uncharacterized protein PV07_08699 [Cladophialophora immunda]|uniref:Uncharacterized protein n=1 Tax=Cladophialophora immunda TaxID=569365 RepID=A0A0D2C2X2_9EURO|nr:uncharacterized protein PV07_08699 [Cladophialophora immunda]KIW25533.1 hypothetical protein PV07_08699 [Cladophialophora immunda]